MAKVTHFWVVTKATKYSTLADILFMSTIQKMRNQFVGGLTAKEIIGIYQFKHEALKVANKELRRFKK